VIELARQQQQMLQVLAEIRRLLDPAISRRNQRSQHEHRRRLQLTYLAKVTPEGVATWITAID
jgi:hypothetical protein